MWEMKLLHLKLKNNMWKIRHHKWAKVHKNWSISERKLIIFKGEKNS